MKTYLTINVDKVDLWITHNDTEKIQNDKNLL